MLELARERAPLVEGGNLDEENEKLVRLVEKIWGLLMMGGGADQKDVHGAGFGYSVDDDRVVEDVGRDVGELDFEIALTREPGDGSPDDSRRFVFFTGHHLPVESRTKFRDRDNNIPV